MKIDRYHFELYCFKVGAFFSETKCRRDFPDLATAPTEGHKWNN